MKEYTVYVLQSLKNGQLYIGFTCNLTRRFEEHNKGQNKSTKGFRPFKILFTKVVKDGKQARLFEKKLKKGYQREKFKK